MKYIEQHLKNPQDDLGMLFLMDFAVLRSHEDICSTPNTQFWTYKHIRALATCGVRSVVAC